MLGLNLNRPRSKWPKKEKPAPKNVQAIQVCADALDTYRKHVARCLWRAETSATLSLWIPRGFMDWMKRSPAQRGIIRKTALVYEDVYARLLESFPDESMRQDFLDSVFEHEAEFWSRT